MLKHAPGKTHTTSSRFDPVPLAFKGHQRGVRCRGRERGSTPRRGTRVTPVAGFLAHCLRSTVGVCRTLIRSRSWVRPPPQAQVSVRLMVRFSWYDMTCGRSCLFGHHGFQTLYGIKCKVLAAVDVALRYTPQVRRVRNNGMERGSRSSADRPYRRGQAE